MGNILWATTNVAESGTFAESPYLYDYVSGVSNYQYTWNEITGGIADNTAPGYCPPDWRLPTKTEYEALIAASNYAWVTNYTNPADGSIVVGGELTIKTTGEKLFFSASGYTNGQSLGSIGYYWSSSQHSYQNGFRTSIDSGGFFPSYGRSKLSAMSLRCVRSVN